MRGIINRICAAAFLVAFSLPSFGCESGHWVASVSDSGSIVVLEDGSVWEINPLDTIYTMLWLPTTEVVACANRLINTEDQETVSARRIR